MAVKTINIKDAFVPELIEVFGQKWQDQILDVDGETLIANPETKPAFANNQFDIEIKNYIHRLVKMYRERASLQAVDNTAITE